MKSTMSSSSRRDCSNRTDETMNDDSDDKDSKRKSRNLSEKKRRDQFNSLVSELSAMVSTSGRKMDKSTVLKSAIAFLKNHNENAARSRANEIQDDWKPTFLTNEEFTHLVLEAVDGFIIVFATNGQIYYVSESITSLLGYLVKDVLKLTIFELASDDCQNTLYNLLHCPADHEGTQMTFSCYLKRGDTNPDKSAYCELVEITGYFKLEEAAQKADGKYREMSGDVEPKRHIFLGTAKIQTPLLIKEMSLVESSRTEFTSRHSLEWKFLFLDDRALPIIGYLPFELLGTSGYDYYHVDDLDYVINCHESLMQKGEGISCCYRFLTKGQQWIWLQTRFYITYHQWNSKPEFVMCTHRVISHMDVLKETRHDLDVSQPAETSSFDINEAAQSTWRSGTKINSNLDCTSMSADSPASRLSEQSMTRSPLNQSPVQPSVRPLPEQPQSQQQYLEPPQYVLQPVLPSYVVQPLPVQPLDNSELQNQLQADLQRKQAELQAIIGQQQQELQRVSEQLLMARLGLLPENQENQQPVQSYLPSAGGSSAAVSSTTTTVPIGSSTVTGSSPAIGPISSSHSNVLYDTSPNSNNR